jgi:hypothetical protein
VAIQTLVINMQAEIQTITKLTLLFCQATYYGKRINIYNMDVQAVTTQDFLFGNVICES